MLNLLFFAVAATADGSLCHVFYGANECGGAMYLMDGPVAPGDVGWLPQAWGIDSLRSEVMQVDSVIDTM